MPNFPMFRLTKTKKYKKKYPFKTRVEKFKTLWQAPPRNSIQYDRKFGTGVSSVSGYIVVLSVRYEYNPKIKPQKDIQTDWVNRNTQVPTVYTDINYFFSLKCNVIFF